MNKLELGCAFAFIGGLIGTVAGPIISLKVADLGHPGYSSDGIGVAGALVLGAPIGAIVGIILGVVVAQCLKDKKDE